MGNTFSWHKRDVVKYPCLGGGAFGSVYLVNKPLSGGEYAVKVVDIPDQESASQAIKEVFTLKHLNGHSNVVQIYSAEISPDKALLIWMEYCDLGDLNSFVTSKMGDIDVKLVVSLIRQLTEAVIYIHGKQVIHRDIKPANILMKSQLISFMGPKLKLGDFGIGKMAEAVGYFNRIYFSTCAGTENYMAPEVRNMRKYTGAADIYSMGQVLKFLIRQLDLANDHETPSVLDLLEYLAIFGSTKNEKRERLEVLANAMTKTNPKERIDEERLHSLLQNI